jgi:hypothetical protein
MCVLSNGDLEENPGESRGNFRWKIGVYFEGFFRSRVTLNWMVDQFEMKNFDSLKRKILTV